MSKLKLIWGLTKVLMPEPLTALVYAGRRSVVDGRRMDASAQAASDLVALLRDPDKMPSVAESRVSLETLTQRFDRPCPASVVTKDIKMPTGRDARIYVPQGGDPMAAQPTLLFLHGGGWVQGSIATHDGLCGRLAEGAGIRVISYDYPLAPEQLFPAAPDDILALYRALIAGEGGLGIAVETLIVGGDSAGGNLTTSLLHSLSAAGDPMPKAQLLIYPSVDGSLSSRSMQVLADQPLLSRMRIDWFLENYLPKGHDRLDPRFSALYSDHLAGQPPAFILPAGHDPLWDDGHAYAKALQGAGVEVEVHPYPGQVHGFMSITKGIGQGVTAASHVSSWLRRVLK